MDKKQEIDNNILLTELVTKMLNDIEHGDIDKVDIPKIDEDLSEVKNFMTDETKQKLENILQQDKLTPEAKKDFINIIKEIETQRLNEKYHQYKNREDAFKDKNSLTSQQIGVFFDVFDDKILTQQYDTKGNMYFNPEGLITLADLINSFSDKNVTMIGKSIDGLSDEYDYFNNAYNQFIEKVKDTNIIGLLTREHFLYFVNSKLFTIIIAARYPKEYKNILVELYHKYNVNIKDEEHFLTRLELANIYQVVKELN